jgi:hypothetical protein
MQDGHKNWQAINSKYSIDQEVYMENRMHCLDVQNIRQKRGEVAERKMKLNLSTKFLGLTNLCQ